VILESAAIKRDLLNAGGSSTLCDCFSDNRGGLDVTACFD
jgi:hypothetical protein